MKPTVSDSATGTGFRHVEAARRRIERGKEAIGLERARMRERVEERGLAGIRIADERDRKHRPAHARAPLQRAPLLHLLQLVLQHAHAARDVALVQLELGLAGPPVLPRPPRWRSRWVQPAHQPGREVLELRQLDLHLALAGARALGEDFQDQLGAIEHAPPELALEVALLRTRQRMVEDHERCVDLVRGAPDLRDLAAAGEEFRIGTLAPPADERVAHRTGALGEAHELVDRVRMVGIAEVETDQDRRLRIRADKGSL
jgi:hypothetical protein